MRICRFALGVVAALFFVAAPSWAGGRVDQGGSGKGTFDAGNCGAQNMEPPCLTIVPTGANTATFDSDGTPLYNLFQIDFTASQPATYTLALGDGVNDTWGSWLCGGLGGAPMTFCTNVPDCTQFGNCATQGNDSTSQFFTSIQQNGNSVVFTFDYGAINAYNQANGGAITSWTFYDTFHSSTTVPEPATMSLMAAGLGLVGFLRRRTA